MAELRSRPGGVGGAGLPLHTTPVTRLGRAQSLRVRGLHGHETRDGEKGARGGPRAHLALCLGSCARLPRRSVEPTQSAAERRGPRLAWGAAEWLGSAGRRWAEGALQSGECQESLWECHTVLDEGGCVCAGRPRDSPRGGAAVGARAEGSWQGFAVLRDAGVPGPPDGGLRRAPWAFH